MNEAVERWGNLLDGRSNPLKITLKERRRMKADGVTAFYIFRDGCFTTWKAVNGSWDPLKRTLSFEKGTVCILDTPTMPIVVSSAPGATFRIMAGDTAISHGIMIDANDLGKLQEGME